MKYILSVCLLVLLTGIATAYTPSSALVDFLETKVEVYEDLIEERGEGVRDKLILGLQDITLQWPANNYRWIGEERFGYIFGYMIERLSDTWPQLLTIDDFLDSYEWFTVIDYPDQLVATVRNNWPFGQTNDDSFENLADFIFGNNSQNTEIAMTSPVTRTQLSDTVYETAFIMPPWWTSDSLPLPNNERVTIKTIPWGLKAVRRFSWWTSQEKVTAERVAFQEDLVYYGITRYGAPTLSQYDGPWVPAARRRNELWVNLNDW